MTEVGASESKAAQAVADAADDSRVKAAIARDLRSGVIEDKLTFKIVKGEYGLAVDSRIRRIFSALEEEGLLIKRGRTYHNNCSVIPA